MAVRARPWRQLVHYYALAVNVAGCGMALVTGHVLMRSLKRKAGLPLVVEKRRLPCHRVVTSVTILGFPADSELSSVRILMA